MNAHGMHVLLIEGNSALRDVHLNPCARTGITSRMPPFFSSRRPDEQRLRVG